MTLRENITPTARVIKTSKNVTAQMKLPTWSRARHGLTPTRQACMRRP